MTTMRRTLTGVHALLRPVVLAVAGVIAAACSESGTGPDEAVSIAFPPFAAPSIVAGDTLRDSLGNAAPLRATAFNGDGDSIATSLFTFFVRDTNTRLRVTPPDLAGQVFLVADPGARTRSVTLLASTAGLQISRAIQVVPRPDSIGATTPRDTVFADTTAAGATILGGAIALSLGVAVLHDSLGAPSVGVPFWLVDYELTGATAATLLDSVRFVDGARLVTGTMTRDTTGASGTAATTLRLFYDADVVLAPGEQRTDSVVVLARARYRTSELRGSPVRFVVRIARLRRGTSTQ